MSSHILVIEEEQQFAQFLKLELEAQGYIVTVCHDGVNGLKIARESHPDLILLDGSSPKLSGLQICRRFRLNGDQLPIILMTAKDELGDRVAGLDAGADDYILKPFSIEGLILRIKANLRPQSQLNPDLLQFLDLSLNLRTKAVYRGDRSLELTGKEYDLLHYFMCHPRKVLTREQILEKVWGYDFRGDSNIIEVYIRYLRIKLEANQEKRLIHTVRKIGYVLKEN
jgi:two-component system OmpR family response regulator